MPTLNKTQQYLKYLEIGVFNINYLFENKGLEELVPLSIVFEAKVLGAHQGTPSLRNGISIVHGHTEKKHFNCI